MRFVDAHIHLSDDDYAGCLDEVISEGRKANVVAFVSNSVDFKTCKESLVLAEKYQGLVYAALGIHPWNVRTITEEEKQQTIELIEEQRNNRALVAIGEIGLDSKYMDVWDKQMKVFNELLHLAEKLDVPVVIHSRGTTTQIVDMLPSYALKKVLLHWFSDPIGALDRIVENGYYLTEGPPTAYSTSIQDIVRKAPLTSLMTETDGPVRYFRKPFEGKRTTPCYIPIVVRAIAEIKQLSETDVSEQILKNFQSFFSIETA